MRGCGETRWVGSRAHHDHGRLALVFGNVKRSQAKDSGRVYASVTFRLFLALTRKKFPFRNHALVRPKRSIRFNLWAKIFIIFQIELNRGILDYLM